MKKLAGLVIIVAGFALLLTGNGGWGALAMLVGLVITWSGERPRT